MNNWDVYTTVAQKFEVKILLFCFQFFQEMYTINLRFLCVCHVENDVRTATEMKNKCVCDSFLVLVNNTVPA